MIEVVFVGTGDAFGSGGRRHTAILLRSGGHTLLLDCGPTTLIGLRELGIDPREIDAVAISHFHGDHSAGLPFLLLDYMFEHERDNELLILGPPGIRQQLDTMTEALCFNTELKRRFALGFREYAVDRKLEIEGFTLTPKPAHHQPHTRPHMLRIETDRRAVFFTGDTGWHEQLPERIGEVDLLISECVFFDDPYEYHLSYRQLEAARPRIRASSILLTHLGSDLLRNLEQVRCKTAHDGLIVKV